MKLITIITKQIFQGSELVVAGLLSGVQSDAPILDYEIEALQANGDYKVKGHFNGSKVSAECTSRIIQIRCSPLWNPHYTTTFRRDGKFPISAETQPSAAQRCVKRSLSELASSKIRFYARAFQGPNLIYLFL